MSLLSGITITTTVVSTLISIDSANHALTTTFTPAAACTSRWFLVDPARDQSTIVGNWNRDRLYQMCHPGNVSDAVYSPGLCPSGQKIARVTEYLTLPEASDQSHRMWQAMCCQNDMTLNFNLLVCERTFFNTPIVVMQPFTINTTILIDSSVVTTATEVYEYVTIDTYAKYGISITRTQSNVTTITTGTMNAEPIVVYWKVKDLTAFGSEYATSLAQAIKVQVPAMTTPATALTAPTSSSVSPGSTLPSSQSSRPSQIAGIVLGAIFGVAFLGLGFYYVYTAHQRKRSPESHSRHPEHQIATPEMGDHDQSQESRKWFLGGKWRSEADGTTRPTEVNADPVQLDNGNHRS